MKKDDVYVYIGDYMEHPDVFDTSFINSKEATKYEKYRILATKDEWDYCYIISIEPFSFGGIHMKCLKSSLISVAEYRKLKIKYLL